MAIDFSLAGSGPQFGNVLAAFQQGQGARKERDTSNALAQYATDPAGGIAALRTVDPVLSMKLQADHDARRTMQQKRDVFTQADPTQRMTQATATGDPEIIQQVMKLDDATKAQKKEATDAAGGFAFGLRTRLPYEQRKAAIQQNAAGLQAAGFTPEQIAAFDPTDANLDGLISQFQTLEQAFKFADIEADNARQKTDAEERKRHNREMETVGAQNADSRRITATRPRAGGAGGSSGVPAGFVLDR